MKAPRKVYILKNNEYIEITLQEHEALQKTMPGYLDKKFVFLHDCLMEVSESFYLDFYKDKRRQKYLDECAAQYGKTELYGKMICNQKGAFYSPCEISLLL